MFSKEIKRFNNFFSIFIAEKEEIYLVGGAVRDFVLGVEPKDWDFATSANPEKIIKILEKNNYIIFPIGIKFGTIGTIIDNLKIDITTFRCAESYKKGDRHPRVIFGRDILKDLVRRDLSINCLALNWHGTLIDPHGGEKDLFNKLIKTPIKPEISFSDDPLRMLRACRFVACGFGQLENSTAKAMEKLAHKIHEVSAERIFEEVSKILMSEKPSKGLSAMVSTGLMREIFPELQTVVEFKQNQGKWHSKLVWPHILQVVDQSKKKLEIKWSALMHDIAKPQTYSVANGSVHFYGHDWKGQLVWDRIAKRLKVSKEFQNHVGQLIYEHLQPSQLSAHGPRRVSKSALRRLARRLGDRLDNLFHLSLADITSHNPKVAAEKRENCLKLQERIHKILEEEDVVRIKLPKNTGLVVADALGIQPGPELGKVMRQLESMLIDGKLSMDADFALEAKKC